VSAAAGAAPAWGPYSGGLSLEELIRLPFSSSCPSTLPVVRNEHRLEGIHRGFLRQPVPQDDRHCLRSGNQHSLVVANSLAQHLGVMILRGMDPQPASIRGWTINGQAIRL